MHKLQFDYIMMLHRALIMNFFLATCEKVYFGNECINAGILFNITSFQMYMQYNYILMYKGNSNRRKRGLIRNQKHTDYIRS